MKKLINIATTTIMIITPLTFYCLYCFMLSTKFNCSTDGLQSAIIITIGIIEFAGFALIVNNNQ